MLSAELISVAREWKRGFHAVVSRNSDRNRPRAPASRGCASRIINQSIMGSVKVNQNIDQRDRTFVNFIFAIWGAHATLCVQDRVPWTTFFRMAKAERARLRAAMH